MYNYIMLHCSYDPSSVYMGHKIYSIKAANMEEAERIGHEWLEERNRLAMISYDKFEYRIFQVTDEVGPRIYSTKEHRRL